MKLYRREPPDFELYTTEVPDGAECLEVGARPYNRDAGRITAIDFKTRTIRRESVEFDAVTLQPIGEVTEPFPDLYFRNADLVFTKESDGSTWRDVNSRLVAYAPKENPQPVSQPGVCRDCSRSEKMYGELCASCVSGYDL